MATLATESWTGTDGASWPVAWAATGTGTSTIQTNKGRQSPAATSFAARINTLSTVSTADVDISGTFTPVTTAVEQYAGVGGRCDTNVLGANASLPQNGIVVQLKAPTSGFTAISLNRCVANVRSQLTGDVAVTLTGTTYGFRLVLLGARYLFRIWDAAGAEPTTWNIDYTDSSPYTTAGRPFLAKQNGTAATARAGDWDNLVVADAGSGAAQSLGLTNGSAAGSITAPGAGQSLGLTNGTAAGYLTGPGATQTLGIATGSATGARQGTGDPVTLTLVAGATTGSTEILGLGASLTLDLSCRDGQGKRYGYVLNTPTELTYAPMVDTPGTAFFASEPRGLTLYRQGGQWFTSSTFAPTPGALALADRIYLGGYTYPLDDTQRAELIAAGFADLLSLEAL